MDSKALINVVHLHTLYKVYRTGIDRYLDMLIEGIVENSEYENIRSHTVFFTDDKKLLFPQINQQKDGEFSAMIPFPQCDILLQKSSYWKNKYIKIVLEILHPYLEGKENLIFQCHNLYLVDMAKELKVVFGGKIVTHLHCIPWKFNSLTNGPLFKRLYQLYQRGEYSTFNKEEQLGVNFNVSDKIICLSEAAREYLKNVHEVDDRKLCIIPNGLSFGMKKCVRLKKNKRPMILYVGKVSKDKGIYQLLDALVKVKSYGYKFDVVLAGSCSPYEFRRIRNEYFLLQVQCLGQVAFEKLQELYSNCTLGVIPSLHEQCSYVALEMACNAVPMIVSNVDALVEMFQHEETALLSPLIFDSDLGLEHDQEALTRNIINLLENKELRQKLSMNVQKLYKNEFSLVKMIDRTVNMYNTL